MTSVVLDASVVVKWFRSAGEADVDAARSIRAEVRQRRVRVVAPSLLGLEILNVAARRWQWDAADLFELARAYGELGLALREPSLTDVALWTARGLTAYDATYVALAASEALRLVTDDRRILDAAPQVAVSLASYARS